MIRTSFLFFILIFSGSSYGAIIPGNLDHLDRLEVLKRVGYSASMKLLSDPYPLGGYSGLEFSLDVNSIPTKSFADLGDNTASGRYYVYPSFKIAKGLYQNIDLLGSFSVYGANNRVGTYGGMIRWTVFESNELPIHISALIHTTNINFLNQFTGDTSGLLLNLGLNFPSSSFYIGFGKVKASATFIGGFGGVTDSGSNEKESSEDFHILVGVVRHFDPYFLAFEMNRYTYSNFSFSTGISF